MWLAIWIFLPEPWYHLQELVPFARCCMSRNFGFTGCPKKLPKLLKMLTILKKLGWWVTMHGIVDDHPLEAGWQSLGWWVTIFCIMTIQGLVGYHPGDGWLPSFWSFWRIRHHFALPSFLNQKARGAVTEWSILDRPFEQRSCCIMSLWLRNLCKSSYSMRRIHRGS